jgi:hypothetical protein
MIHILRDGQFAVLHFDLRIPTWETRSYPLRFNCGGEAYAGLLTAAMNKELEDTVRQLRSEAYAEGWADAKAKKVRANHFNSYL